MKHHRMNGKSSAKKAIDKSDQLVNSRNKIECNPHIEVNPTIIGFAPLNVSDIQIIPIVKRHFYIPQNTLSLVEGANFPANFFTNDRGEQVDEFTTFSPNGYVNLFINGVMQEGSLYVVGRNFLSIHPVEQSITAGTPIIVESIGFTAKITV
ncbi:DUF4183 domain-containing protein [Bacillus sp. FJAT-50079]|uniref:DUF4183 domain-containing protein n=1 Tax=Bacillus sp. FJAT-50079 TaxID=2833577 RepID=UPI001BC9E838|nr:DUF4183 domain-containing protein [Bacillus sp. FJAT-50079]MBS4209008.1 DUF4183 domain-containing protein [Bacillus sp. FJAT-50079]